MKIDYPFSNHMVLQRNKRIIISGQSDDRKVDMMICGKKYTSQVDHHHWQIEVQFDFYGGPYEMIFNSGDETIVYDDILIGDVFLAAGQSNMEMTLSQTDEKQLPVYKDHVRFLNVPQYSYPFNQKEQTWQKLTKDNSGELSAIAAFFSYYLQVDVPLGIISNNKGGTSASCWMSETYLKKDEEIKKAYWDDYYDGLPSIEQQKKNAIEYYQLFDNYQEKFKHYQSEHKEMSLSQIKNKIGHTPWPPPKGIYDFGKPSGLYEHMFKKTLNYPIKAILYYQGEEDSSRYMHYQKLLSLLIDNWREDYKECVPFIIIQLPEYQNSHFSEVRLAQWQVSKEKENTYLVVSLLTGNPTYIHPTRKQELARRIAMSVEKNIYHHVASVSPEIKNIEQEENDVVIYFDQLLKPGHVHFVVDLQSVEGIIKDCYIKIPVSSYYEIDYALDDCPQVEIMNLDGLPCSPFILKK